MAAFFPDISKALGPYVPLIVVNCIILGRQEAFSSKNPVFRSIIDALGMGLGFTLSLLILSSLREILSNIKYSSFKRVNKSRKEKIERKIM